MRAFAALLMLPLSLACAHAATPARAVGSFAPAPGSAPAADQTPLSAEAVRSCVSRQVQARREQDELAGPNAADAQRRDDLARRQDALEADRKALDPKNNAAVKAFNAKAAAFKADREALNRDVAAANARTDKHNALLASIAADCRGHSFYQDDFEAAMKDFPDAKL